VEIVVDEWLLEYLRPDAEGADRLLALTFVNAWKRRCDRLLLPRPSPFLTKFYRYMKTFGRDLDFEKRFSKLNHLLLRNARKTRILDRGEVPPLPKEVADMIDPDDWYLIEAARCSEEKVLVTTDGPLREQLSRLTGFVVYSPAEFLAKFLPQE
jgi:predicted nucleic acid-binding protein